MFKPLTFSLSLAVALGACSLGFAGGHGKTLPSPQGAVAPSAQGALASPQGDCGDGCGATEKKCHLFDMLKPKPKCYSYEWVLKKKRCGGGLLGGLMHGSKGGCDSCGGGEIATPSAQWASPQAGATFGSGQGALSYGSGQAGTFGSGQIGGSAKYVPTSTSAPAAMVPVAPVGDAVPAVDAGVAPESAPLPPAANPTDSPSTAGLLYLSPAGN